MRKKFVEVTCNYCLGVCIYEPGNVNEDAREDGWIISKYGDFDSKDCFKKFKKQLKTIV